MNSFGLESKHLEILQKLVFIPLKKKMGCKVWVFGSRARGDHQKFSDLDLLIEGNVDPKILSKVREDLDESSLPIKVDIVLNSELAESYRNSVEKDRVLVR
jgi:predicted nucleotidyltransferase